MNDKMKKQLAIVVSVIVVVLALIAGFLFFTQTGKDTRNEASVAFQPVEVPQDSRELSKVPTAPVNQPDKNDDPFLNRDMLGQRIADESIVVELPVEEKKNGDGNNNKANGRGRGVTTTTIKPPTAEEMKQVSNTGVEFSIPSVGLYTPLGSLEEVRGIVRPTNFNNVFQITNRGVPYNKTNEGTTYLAAHTLDADQLASGLAPGNFVIDAESRQPRAKIGDKVKIGNETFSITEMRREGKGVISNDENIWDGSVKGRMVLLLCFPSSNDNYLVIAQRD